MDFAFTPDQIAVKDGILAFARERLNSSPTGDDEVFPWEKWAQCADFGLLGLVLPKSMGAAATIASRRPLRWKRSGRAARITASFMPSSPR